MAMTNKRMTGDCSSRFAYPFTFLVAFALKGQPGSLRQSMLTFQPPGEACTSNSERWVLDLRPGQASGYSGFTGDQVERAMADPLSYGVWDDLIAFTGLSEPDLMERLRRKGRHHFEVEHRYYEPRSKPEITMYYRSSLGYLWGNAMHPGVNHSAVGLTPADGPVLDYSGGIGKACLDSQRVEYERCTSALDLRNTNSLNFE